MAVTQFAPPPGAALWPHITKWGETEWRHWLGQLEGWDEAKINQYWKDRFDYGLGVKVPKSQAIHWLYLPTPKQVEFHRCTASNVLYGGARGGAKSHALRWDIHKRCLMRKDYRAILFRRTLTELKDNHIDKIRLEIAAGLPADYKESEKTVVYCNGSTLRLAHCEHEGDEDKYLSSEYDSVDPDELATFTKKQIFGILGSARSIKEGVTSVFRASSNPSGAHTLWCVDYFMDHLVDREDDPYYDPTDWIFIPSRLYDNPNLMDPDGSFRRYEKRLSGLSKERRRQLLEGDWTAVAGQFFNEVTRATHVKELPIPKGVSWERWIDWGYNAPGYCIWVACLPDGRLYGRFEYKFTQTIAADVADNIVRYTKELGDLLVGEPIRLRKTVGDPSMWNHTGHTGESIAETFSRHGVWMQKGDNDRVMGWQRMRHFFAPAPDGLPWFVWHPSCVYAIRTIPSLVSDKTKPEDVDTTGDDHPGDAHRYGFMARPAPSNTTPTLDVPKGSAGWLMQQLRRPARHFLGHESLRA